MSYSKDELIKYRIERSHESFKDAEYLIKEERWNAAANRMYYGIKSDQKDCGMAPSKFERLLKY